MDKINLIKVTDICNNFNIDEQFINNVIDYELIEVTDIDGDIFFNEDDLSLLEKITHFYYDLEINFAGIQVILELLEKIDALQQKINKLQNGIQEIE